MIYMCASEIDDTKYDFVYKMYSVGLHVIQIDKVNINRCVLYVLYSNLNANSIVRFEFIKAMR